MHNQLIAEGFLQRDNVFTKEVKGGKVEIALTNSLIPFHLVRSDTNTRLCLLLKVEEDKDIGLTIKNWKEARLADFFRRLNTLDLSDPLPCFHLFG